jgi:two-component sensor histidine kinase
MRKIVFILLFGLGALAAFSAPAPKETKHLIDSLMESYQPVRALLVIDSVLANKRPMPLGEKKELIWYRCRSLHRIEQFKECLTYARKVLRTYPNDSIFKANILCEMALVFELIGALDQCKMQLDQVDQLLNKHRTHRSYGLYLIRLASYYRISGNLKMAKEVANVCAVFTKKHNFPAEAATANMLQGLMAADADTKLKHFRTAMYYWRITNDVNGLSAMYAGISRELTKKHEYDSAMMYCDSNLMLLKKFPSPVLLTEPLRQKGAIFEAQKQYDSALFYRKKYEGVMQESEYTKHNEAIRKLDYIYSEEKSKALIREAKRETALTKTKNNQLLMTLGVLLVLIVLISYLVLRLKRSRQRIGVQNETLTENNAQLEQLVSDKTVLVQEVNHRVKNNLSLILSLIEFQKVSKSSSDLNTLKNRVNSIAVAHQLLLSNYDATASKGPVRLSRYLEKVMEPIIQLSGRKLTKEIRIEEVALNADTLVPIGMLITELLSNSLKHAETEKGELNIFLEIEVLDEAITIRYTDNGKTFEISKSDGNMGLMIIESMVKQLKGKYHREESQYTIQLKAKNE